MGVSNSDLSAVVSERKLGIVFACRLLLTVIAREMVVRRTSKPNFFLGERELDTRFGGEPRNFLGFISGK